MLSRCGSSCLWSPARWRQEDHWRPYYTHPTTHVYKFALDYIKIKITKHYSCRHLLWKDTKLPRGLKVKTMHCCFCGEVLTVPCSVFFLVEKCSHWANLCPRTSLTSQDQQQEGELFLSGKIQQISWTRLAFPVVSVVALCSQMPCILQVSDPGPYWMFFLPTVFSLGGPGSAAHASLWFCWLLFTPFLCDDTSLVEWLSSLQTVLFMGKAGTWTL